MIIEIEDKNGNTILAFEISKDGKIGNIHNCNVADEDKDYIFNTTQKLIRIQEI